MRVMDIPPTHKTPHVIIDVNSGIITLTGRSIPEVPNDFYKPLMEALDQYRMGPEKDLIMEFDLEYFNTSSAKTFMDIFKKLKGKRVKVAWFYEEDDSDILEAGEDFKTMLSGAIEVDIIKKPKKADGAEKID